MPLSLVVGILGDSTWHALVLRVSFWPFLASSVVNEGRKWVVVMKESHRGPVTVASAEIGYIRMGCKKKKGKIAHISQHLVNLGWGAWGNRRWWW